jgi:hypothetical protein
MKRRSKGIRKSSRRRRSKPKNNPWNITTIEQFYALSEFDQQEVLGMPRAVSLMKETHISASAAARASWVSPRTFITHARSALRKIKNGRYVPKRNDDLFRPVIVLSINGQVEVATRSFRQASEAGQHSSAVERYLETGDDSALRRFKGKYITDAQGNRIMFLTDLDELDRLGSAGELSFESLYLRSR